MNLLKKLTLVLTVVVSVVTSYAQERNSRIFEFDNPKVRVVLPETGKETGRAIIVCPGGGYSGLAIGHEGNDWVDFFNEKGIAVAVLSYEMPSGNHTVPFADVEKTMKVLLDNKGKWNIDSNDIGIMGFSAGGHLASTYATHAASDLSAAFQILFYPVVTMDPSYTHMGSHDNLLGANPGKDLEELYSNEKQVNATTPRALIFYSNDDDVVPPMNGVNYYKALHEAGVPASLHIYPTGGHGWGYSDGFKYHDQMIEELSAWLESF